MAIPLRVAQCALRIEKISRASSLSNGIRVLGRGASPNYGALCFLVVPSYPFLSVKFRLGANSRFVSFGFGLKTIDLIMNSSSVNFIKG